DAEADPVQLLVEPTNQNLPFYAVVATQEVTGEITVAAAAQENAGVYLSTTGGNTGTFRKIGLDGESVRTLAVQRDGPRSFLCAGTAAPGGVHPGRGVAVSPSGAHWMAGGAGGVARTGSNGTLSPSGTGATEPKYENTSSSEFQEEVTLPPTWLFTCSENEIEVVSDAPG